MKILPYATHLSRTGVVTADPENKCKSPYAGLSFWAGGFGPPNIRSFWAVSASPFWGRRKRGVGEKKRGGRAYFLGDIHYYIN